MSYINALETFRVYFYFEAALPFLGENIAELHTAVFRALFYGKILDPIVLFVVPIYRGKLQQLIKIYNEENPNNRQLQQKGGNQTERYCYAPHHDRIAAQAEF